eukprot:gnl/TRDRNA2_/TRDRNA2_151180_c0_seq2.p1 gnl/TRDRNA2_/TRDRNA2_151180_c0~~gnl/TRDRNA2_/TRDRNA2_151180_c0_seq2.p1  ORF type:complete len:355 (+),score=94.70 gnl/TRDRNA2_/TRDRNA2_151180_c0_seq2:87-1067(+)
MPNDTLSSTTGANTSNSSSIANVSSSAPYMNVDDNGEIASSVANVSSSEANVSSVDANASSTNGTIMNGSLLATAEAEVEADEPKSSALAKGEEEAAKEQKKKTSGREKKISPRSAGADGQGKSSKAVEQGAAAKKADSGEKKSSPPATGAQATSDEALNEGVKGEMSVPLSSDPQMLRQAETNLEDESMDGHNQEDTDYALDDDDMDLEDLDSNGEDDAELDEAEAKDSASLEEAERDGEAVADDSERGFDKCRYTCRYGKGAKLTWQTKCKWKRGKTCGACTECQNLAATTTAAVPTTTTFKVGGIDPTSHAAAAAAAVRRMFR